MEVVTIYISNLMLVLIVFYYMFLFSTVLLDLRITNKISFLFSLFFVLSISLLAYKLEPDPSLDLFRYFNYLDSIKNVEVKNLFTHGAYSNTLLIQTYFYIISQTNNFYLLSSITSAFVFTLIFYICYNFRKKLNVTFQETAFYILAIISVATLAGIISGVRQNLAWVLLAFSIYRDFFKRSHNPQWKFLTYILPALVHMSTLPFILIRVILPIFRKFNLLKYLVLLWPITISALEIIKNILPKSLESPINSLINYANGSFNLTPKFIVSFLGYLVILYFIIKIKDKKDNVIFSDDFFLYYTIIVFFGVASVFIPTLFTRTFEYTIYISLPIISLVFKSKFHNKYTFIYLLLFLFLFLFYYTDLHSGYPFL